MTSYGEKLPDLFSRRKTIDNFESDLLTFTAIVGTAFIVGGGIIAWRQGKTSELGRLYIGGVVISFVMFLYIRSYSNLQRVKNWNDYQRAYINTQPYLVLKDVGDIMEEGGREVVDDAPTLAEAIDKAQQLHNSTGETYEIEHHQDQQVDAYTQDGKLFETWVDNKLVKQHA